MITEEQVTKIAKILFETRKASNGLKWDNYKYSTHEGWERVTRLVIIGLEANVPRDELAAYAHEEYRPGYEWKSNSETSKQDWEEYVTICVAKYLLTPKTTKETEQ